MMDVHGVFLKLESGNSNRLAVYKNVNKGDKRSSSDKSIYEVCNVENGDCLFNKDNLFKHYDVAFFGTSWILELQNRLDFVNFINGKFLFKKNAQVVYVMERGTN